MKNIVLISFLILMFNAVSQPTVGVLKYDSNAFQGYNLIAQLNQDTTYLIDNCGEIVNYWSSTYPTANKSFLDSNGYLWRAGKSVSSNNIGAGGVGGIIEKFDWNANIVWSYLIDDSLQRQHHDFLLMPNGNILYIS